MSLKENTEILNIEKANTVSEEKSCRLQVYLSHAGIASRRSAEKIIAQGRVSVNGKPVQTPGEKVHSFDEIRLDGVIVKPESRLLYVVLNKPPFYLSSSYDPGGRPLALDLLANVSPFPVRLYNIGRLDYLSSGLLLFTNDGNFAAAVGHPRAQLEKEYLVDSTVPIPDYAVEAFARGVMVDGELYRAHFIEKTGKKSLRVVLIEGKNREIRRVFSHFRLHAERIHRVRIGSVTLGDLEEGKFRPLSTEEIKKLGYTHP